MYYFHLFFSFMWFSCLLMLIMYFYSHHAKSEDETTNAQYKKEERRMYYLYATPSAVLSVGTGIWLWLSDGFVGRVDWILMYKWLLVLILTFFHLCSWRFLTNLKVDRNVRSRTFYQWFGIVMFIVYILALLPLIYIPWTYT